MNNNKLIEEHTIKKEKIYEGKIIKVRVDTVELPNKVYAKREIVEHARGVGVVAITENQEIILVKQYRKAIDSFIYEIPAGIVESGENIQDAAVRELEEETGYKPNSTELIAEAYVSPGFTDEKLSIFYTDSLEKTQMNLDETEFLIVEEVPIKKALDMVDDFEINDAKTVIGIMFAARKLGLW